MQSPDIKRPGFGNLKKVRMSLIALLHIGEEFSTRTWINAEQLRKTAPYHGRRNEFNQAGSGCTSKDFFPYICASVLYHVM